MYESGPETEGANFWLSVLTDLNNRGTEDILIACVPTHRMQAFDRRVIDGLTGFSDPLHSTKSAIP